MPLPIILMAPANNVPGLLVGRKIDQEFLAQLEIIDDRRYPMPGAVTKNPGDPRINVSTNTTRSSDEVVLAEHLATIRHRSSGRVFQIYRDTVDALFLESQDVKQYPKWLLEDPRKQNERSIRINEMLRPPTDKYDRGWLGDVLEDRIYDTLAYFLYNYLQK